MSTQYIRYPSQNGGTVISVGLALPASVFSVTGSPVTGSGTLTGAFISQSANQVLASPNGSSGVPTFRALVSADLPAGTGTVTSVAASTNSVSGLTISGSPITTSGTLAFTLAQSTTSTSGYLSPADWNTFNNKQPAGSYITALTGDATASGPGSVPLTLATVNSNVGTFGSSTSIPTITVNAKGLVTAASGNAVIAPAGTLTGTTLASNVVSSSLTSVGTITSGTWNGTTIAIANGGTGQTTASAAFAALSPLTTAGDLIYENNTPAPARLPIGTAGQIITTSSGLPAWLALDLTGVNTSLSGALGASHGGTGQTTLTANNILLGNGTSPVQFVAPGTNRNRLVSNGTTWVSVAPLAGVSMTLSADVTGFASATDQKINYNLTQGDPNSIANTVTSTITVAVTGWYHIYHNVAIYSQTALSLTRAISYIYINGVQTYAMDGAWASGTTTIGSVMCSIFTNLNSGDTVQGWARASTSAGTWAVAASSGSGNVAASNLTVIQVQ